MEDGASSRVSHICTRHPLHRSQRRRERDRALVPMDDGLSDGKAKGCASQSVLASLAMRGKWLHGFADRRRRTFAKAEDESVSVQATADQMSGNKEHDEADNDDPREIDPTRCFDRLRVL